MDTIFELHRGTAPLLVSVPHDGSEIPPRIARRMDRTRAHRARHRLARLAPVRSRARTRRIDPAPALLALRRRPQSARRTMYRCTRARTRRACARPCSSPAIRCKLDGQAPDRTEVAQRVEPTGARTTTRLQGELHRLRDAHGRVVLWEGHTIRGSDLPFLFEGRLPDLNLGTSDGASCSPALQAKLEGVLAAQSEFDWVANGRFKGGYITRHYAAPGEASTPCNWK
jgi:N-formylglutamate deformylase